jgi:solute carrier family 25 carnitine/acylcarnitine transporter 20/29
MANDRHNSNPPTEPAAAIADARGGSTKHSHADNINNNNKSNSNENSCNDGNIRPYKTLLSNWLPSGLFGDNSPSSRVSSDEQQQNNSNNNDNRPPHKPKHKKSYQQAQDDHIPIPPLFFLHPGSHHHAHVPAAGNTKKLKIQETSTIPTTTNENVVDININNNDEVIDGDMEVTTLHDLMAGAIAGSASVVVGHPFDTIKVRMQTGSGTAGTSGLLNAKAIKGLFRGMGPPLGAAGMVNALVFSSYGWTNRLWDDYNMDGEKILEQQGDNTNQQSVQQQQSASELKFKMNWKAYFCGCFAGLTQTFVLCPTEHVKCRLQVQASSPHTPDIYKGPVDCTQQIIKSHGVFRGLYRGWTVTAWREVPAFGLYFTSYDFLKEHITAALHKRQGQGWDQPWIASGLSGGVSGCITWLAVYPFDFIKSRIQTAPLDCNRGIWATGQNILREGGLRLMFRGLGVTLMRAFPVNGVIFPVYEFTVLQLTGGDRMVD